MVEKEYIERNDLINNRPPQRNPDQTGKEEYNKGYNDGVKAFLNCVKEQPVDDNVVEVVRCKDCKYLMFSDCYGECSRGYLGIVRPECYCCYGERRE